MQSTTAWRTSAQIGHLRRWYISFFRVAKNDSATAFSWQLPVRPIDSLTSLAATPGPAKAAALGRKMMCCAILAFGDAVNQVICP